MDVGNLNHAIAFETLWEGGDVQRDFMDHKVAYAFYAGVEDHAECTEGDDTACHCEESVDGTEEVTKEAK